MKMPVEKNLTRHARRITMEDKRRAYGARASLFNE